MSEPDDELEVRLRALLQRADPVPPLVLEAGRAALGWRRLDAELAELLTDSAADPGEAFALARGGEARLRSVTFGAQRRTLDLEITHLGSDRRLRGAISPPAELEIEIQRADGASLASVRSDTFGRFLVEIPGGATIRLRLLDPQDGPIETSWVGL